MVPVQTGVGVLLRSLLALGVYAGIAAIIVRDARSRNVDSPAAWGLAVFLAMLLGTLFVPNQLFGAIAGGSVAIGFYLVIART